MINISFKNLIYLYIALYSSRVVMKYSISLITPIKQRLSRGVLRKACSENMQKIYRRTTMTKYDFSKVDLQLY